MSQAGKIIPYGILVPIDSITGNTGGAVGPDGFGNINFVGAGIASVAGVAGTNTLTINITDPVPVANGGTGAATLTDHGIMLGSGTGAVTILAEATDGQIPIGSTGNDCVLSVITGTTIAVTNGPGTINLEVSGGTFLTGLDGDTGTSLPTLGKISIVGGNSITTSAALSAVTVNVSGTIDHAIQLGNATNSLTSFGLGTATQVLQSGGAGADPAWSTATYPATTLQGDVIYSSANDTVVGLAKDANATRYISNTGATNNPAWAQIELTNGVTGILPVPNGGTGAATLTDHGIILGSGVGAVTVLAEATDGQIPIGSTGNDCVLSTITAGNNIGVTNAAGAITVDVNGTTQYAVQVGDATNSLDSLAIGSANQVLHSNGAGANPSWSAIDLAADVTGTLPVANGGTGVVTLTANGLMYGDGVSPVASLAEATDGQIPIGSTGNIAVLGNITSATDLTVTNGPGTINVDLTADTNITAVHGWNGSLIESAAVTVTAAGGVITLSIEKVGTGNLTAIFSDGFDNWVTAPDTVTLTAGADDAPTLNYVYYLQSTKTLTASTVGWPATEFAAVATVLCQSAASLQTDGAYKMHAWTDHVTSFSDQGHLSMINRWIRQQNATWVSGVGQTLTITPQGGAADNVIFTSAAGLVYQLHEHTFPAFAGTPDIYTVNDPGVSAAYTIVTDLNALLTDSTGASMSGNYFTLVIWGVVSEATGDCKLMVNLPSGSYNTQAGVEADTSKYANYSIPSDFKGTGFLIYEIQLKHSVAASGTWTSVQNIDLLGLIPSNGAGGSTSFSTEFPDNVFRILDDGDSTKEIAFEASAITTGTTRTITMDDRDISMAAVATTVATDSGNAVAASGTLTLTGGNNIGTSGTGSAVTIDLNGTTQYAVQVGDATGSLDSLGVGATNQVLLANTGANPSWGAVDLTTDVTGTLPVANGGIGVATLTPYAVTCGGTTTTNPIQSIASVGTADQVLTSNGAGALPTFQDAGGGGGGASVSSFLAYPSAQSTTTGDGTTYTMTFANEDFDVGGDFDGTSTYTAPETGKYFFKVNLLLSGLTSAHTSAAMRIDTTSYNTEVRTNPYAIAYFGSSTSMSHSIVTDLTASDTVTIKITVFSGTKVISFQSDHDSFFCGHLIA